MSIFPIITHYICLRAIQTQKALNATNASYLIDFKGGNFQQRKIYDAEIFDLMQ